MTFIRRRKGALVAVALAFCAGAAALPAQAETLRLLMPWNMSSAGNTALGELITTLIEENTDGEVTLQKFDNGVVPPFEQLEPVASGVFDIHYTDPNYHAGDTVVGQIMDTVIDDIEKRRSSGIWDMIDQAYQKRNLKLVAAAPHMGYQFILRTEPSAEGALNGLKIRSNPAYDGTIRSLGGAPIQLPVTEVYSAMEKNLIDGTAFPVHGVLSSKIGEVAKYQMRPTFSQSSALILMNLDKWNSLSPELQEKLLQAGRDFEAQASGVIDEIAAEDEAGLIAQGVPTKRFGDEAAARITLYHNEGIWNQASKNGGEEADQLIRFVKDNNLVFSGR